MYVVGTQKNHLNETVRFFWALKDMLKLMGKKIFTFLHQNFLLSKPVYFAEVETWVTHQSD